jgi:DNA-binding transcriptional LysR family regulator
MHRKLYKGVAIAHQEAPDILRSISWDDLRIFLSCAEHQSFRKAANDLRINSTTIVRRIERLEHIFGCRLFVRHSDGVSVTADGLSITESARTMQRATADVVRQLQVTREGIRGLVRISISDALGTYWVLPRLLEFQKAHRFPSIEFQQNGELADIGRLQADMAVQFRRPQRPDLIAIQLGYLHIYPFASDTYIQAYGIPKALSDLRSHRLIQQVYPLCDKEFFEQALGDEILEGIVAVKTNSGSAVLYAVEHGIGIGALPNYSLVLGAKLVPIDLGIKSRLDLWMTYHPDIRKSESHMMVVNWLRQVFDSRKFPCFTEVFSHPHELIGFMAPAVCRNGL